MHRFYILVSATLLTAFIAVLVLRRDSEMIEPELIKIEESDLEDVKEDKSEEIEFQLKDFDPFSKELALSTKNRTILVDYLFAIKSNYQQVSIPPPEA